MKKVRFKDEQLDRILQEATLQLEIVYWQNQTTFEVITIAKKWQTWRSYAVIQLWHGAS
jgi:3-methyladenine DNA glycosylase/8-oxoguanine DNA glycosylase